MNTLALTQEADILAAAARIMRKYRPGLMGAVTDLDQTEQALRDEADRPRPPAVDEAA